MFTEIISISFMVFSAHFTKSLCKRKIWSVSLMLLLLFGAENRIMTTFVLFVA